LLYEISANKKRRKDDEQSRANGKRANRVKYDGAALGKQFGICAQNQQVQESNNKKIPHKGQDKERRAERGRGGVVMASQLQHKVNLWSLTRIIALNRPSVAFDLG